MTGQENSHILLIERNPVTCVMLASVLRKSGYQVTCVDRPDEGLHLPDEDKDIALVVIGGGRSRDEQDTWARQLRPILPMPPRTPFVRLEQTFSGEAAGMPPEAETEFSGSITRPLDPAAIVELVHTLL